jgi:hypothetical protein
MTSELSAPVEISVFLSFFLAWIIIGWSAQLLCLTYDLAVVCGCIDSELPSLWVCGERRSE